MVVNRTKNMARAAYDMFEESVGRFWSIFRDFHTEIMRYWRRGRGKKTAENNDKPP